MKIYTEEQVITFAIKVLSDYEINGTFYNREKLKEALDVTPIELPSDDDMANASNHCKDGQVKVGFLRGVLWLKEQILNQNK